MGRHRKPTAQLEREGAFVAHPERKAERANEPKAREGAVGPPPKCFTVAGGCSEYTSERLISIWEQIIDEAPPGVLTASDRLHIEETARAIYRTRTSGHTRADLKVARDLLADIAMNPTARARVIVAPTGAPAAAPTNAKHVDSPFSDIAAETNPGRVN